MGILILIAEILFAKYWRTRPKKADGSHVIWHEDEDIDLSFFSARQITPAMEVATRVVFFQRIAGARRGKSMKHLSTEFDFKRSSGSTPHSFERTLECHVGGVSGHDLAHHRPAGTANVSGLRGSRSAEQ